MNLVLELKNIFHAQLITLKMPTIHVLKSMGESSKYFKNSNFKTGRMPTKMNNFMFKLLIVSRSSEN